MGLLLDEQRLLNEFRRLRPEEKAELLDYAVFLAKKSREHASADAGVPATNQCRLDGQGEARPEAAKEPVFTE
jgi:hypothetical protein